MTKYLEEMLLRRKRFGNLRQLQPAQNLIDFSSNDYLGLARSSTFASAVSEECRRLEDRLNGIGSTGSRLLTGNSLYAQDLENQIAVFHGYPAGLLFSCGYMANVGLLSMLGGSRDVIFFDAQVHASIHDGICLSRAHAFPFRHNDPAHLESRLKNCSNHGERFICIESIYSTDGQKAPLLEICRLARAYDAHLIVDEAHAVGVCGPCGRGLVAEQNLVSDVFAQVTTFGKALGAYGAIVLGSNTLKQALINFATPYIYTTALPFHSLAAIKCSYDLFPKFERERKHLQSLISCFLENASFKVSETPIQSVPIKGNEAVKKASQALFRKGFDIRPLMSPTVQQGCERLRVCLHAFNTKNELIELLTEIESLRICDEA